MNYIIAIAAHTHSESMLLKSGSTGVGCMVAWWFGCMFGESSGRFQELAYMVGAELGAEKFLITRYVSTVSSDTSGTVMQSFPAPL